LIEQAAITEQRLMTGVTSGSIEYILVGLMAGRVTGTISYDEAARLGTPDCWT
jgi:hypothetical protein